MACPSFAGNGLFFFKFDRPGRHYQAQQRSALIALSPKGAKSKNWPLVGKINT